MLLVLFLLPALWPSDDPPFDEPKTSLFDYRLIEGGLYVSYDPLNSLRTIDALVTTTQAGPNVSWHGFIDLHIPWDQMKDFEWSDWDVAVGGQWNLKKTKKKYKDGKYGDGTLDQLFGVGIEVVSYMKNGPGYLTFVDESEEMVAQDRIRASLQGALATLGWIFLSQNEDTTSVDSSIQLGVGIGRFGFNGIEQSIGRMGNARLEASIFDGGGNVLVIFSGATNGESNAFQLAAGINMELGNHVNIGMQWKSEGFEGKSIQTGGKLRASLNQLEFKIGAGL